MSKDSILLIEDNPVMQKMIENLISPIGAITIAGSISEATAAMESENYALLILDADLSDGDGFSFCEKLRATEKFYTLPIVLLTDKTDIADRVRGFEIGADDYIIKPPEPAEFLARIKAKLTRRGTKKNQSAFTKDIFKLDLNSQKLFKENMADDLGLTPIEFKIFSLLIKNAGNVFSREELKKSVWGPTIHLSDHTVDTHVSSLRKKLGDHSSCIKAVIKQGYTYTFTIKN